MTATGALIRAASSARLGPTELAEASGLALGSVKIVEDDLTAPTSRTIAALSEALQVAGLLLLGPGDVHLGGHGVRLKAVEQRRAKTHDG